MSADPAFRCPVCRARQPLNQTCRRCQADLSLVVRSHRRLNYLIAQRDEARANGNREREETITEEIRWLLPAR